jgi:copper(I)-binding protein
MRYFSFVFAVLVSLAYGQSVHAHSAQIGKLEIHHPWITPTTGSVNSGNVIAWIENNGDEPDRIISASTPIAATALVQGAQGQAAIDLPAKKTVKFAPDGARIVLQGLTRTLDEYDTFKLDLVFEHAGKITVEVHVDDKKPAAKK